MADPPWRLDLMGIVPGSPPGDLIAYRHGLSAQDYPDDNCTMLDSSDGSISVLVCLDKVAVINFHNSARIDGVEIIGYDRRHLRAHLGDPSRIEFDNGILTYEEGNWELQVGISRNLVAWVSLVRNDLLGGLDSLG